MKVYIVGGLDYNPELGDDEICIDKYLKVFKSMDSALTYCKETMLTWEVDERDIETREKEIDGCKFTIMVEKYNATTTKDLNWMVIKETELEA